MIESIKLKVNEAMFLLMKKLDKSLAYEKKTRKIAPKRVSINDKIRTIKTWKELFHNDLEEKDPKNRPLSYWRNKD